MKYNIETKCVELSVAELCLHTFGVGEYTRTSADDEAVNLMTELNDGYNPSLEVTKSFTHMAINFKLTGMVDGLIEMKGGMRTDVVRCVSPSRVAKPPREELWGYIRCCAYLVCLRDGLEVIYTRVVHKSSADGEIKIYEKKFYISELEATVKNLLSSIQFRINHTIFHETGVRTSALDLKFPYSDIREGQDEMMRGVASVIRKKRRMFAQAPTGIGKTVSVLYPAVRAFGKRRCDKIFYFTAKTDTAREAYAAAGRLCEAGAKLKTVVLSSKDAMCCSEKAKNGGCRDARYCNERDCQYAKRYKDKAGAAIEELMSKQNGFYASVITEVANKYDVCPYELSLDLSELCDIIICDYNYLFDPFVHIKRYFDRPGDFGEYVFLIDEAHNLVDRARAIYSATLSRCEIETAYSAVGSFVPELGESFSYMISALKETKKLCRDNMRTDAVGNETGYYISRNSVVSVSEASIAFGERLEKWIKYNKDSEFYEIIDRVYSSVRKFNCVLEYYDDKFMTYVELAGAEITVSLNCIDPSDILDGILSLGRASVMFSATLAPLSYFCDLLGGGKKSLCLELASPYEQKNLCVAAVDTVSTRFEDRDKSYKKIATCIAAAVSPKAGNYIAYFPSYGYLEKVHEAFVKKYPKVRTIVQRRGMSRAQHEEFIESFKDDENKMRIGFCVLGGSFSEGVDLPGNRLIGSIIVGVGLPGFSSERNIMRDYFENRYENGFEYAYTYPGMNNVLQAAGRVIRREEDKGIVVLIDDRYGLPTYQKLFPKHWNHLRYVGDAASLAEVVGRFWRERE